MACVAYHNARIRRVVPRNQYEGGCEWVKGVKSLFSCVQQDNYIEYNKQRMDIYMFNSTSHISWTMWFVNQIIYFLLYTILIAFVEYKYTIQLECSPYISINEVSFSGDIFFVIIRLQF